MNYILSFKGDSLSYQRNGILYTGRRRIEKEREERWPMPTERFCRLPKEKQEAIRTAALREFARVPYEQASINQIIRYADISRGSFYTYFTDKRDVVEFLLHEQFVEMEQVCKDVLRETGGDYFAMLERMFDFFVESLQEDKSKAGIARNIFSSQESAQVLGMGKWPSPAKIGMEGSPARWTYDHIDKSRFRCESLEGLVPVMIASTSALVSSLKQFYDYPEQLDLIRKYFLGTLDILKYGAYRQANKE